jgi:hypothetical protein
MTIDFVKKCGTVQLALQAKCEVICHRAYKVRKPVKKKKCYFLFIFLYCFFRVAFPYYSRLVVSNEAFFVGKNVAFYVFFFFENPFYFFCYRCYSAKRTQSTLLGNGQGSNRGLHCGKQVR